MSNGASGSMSSSTVFAPAPANFYTLGVYVPDRTAFNVASTSAPSTRQHERRPNRVNNKPTKQKFRSKAPKGVAVPAGGFFGLPDLQQLRQSNKKQAKRHFKKGRKSNPAPPSVPHAPHNSNSYLLRTGGLRAASPALCDVPFHAVTPNPFAPGTAWNNGYGELDRDAAELGALAGIDMYGTNAGLIARTAPGEPSGMDDDDEDESLHGASDPESLGFELLDEPRDDGSAAGPDTAGLRARLAEQAAYVAELEEHNLNLQEKVFLLQQQLSEAQGALQRSSHTVSRQEERQRGGASGGTAAEDDGPAASVATSVDEEAVGCTSVGEDEAPQSARLLAQGQQQQQGHSSRGGAETAVAGGCSRH